MPDYAHTSVLAGEAARLVVTARGGTYVDATVGGGGHTREILSLLAPAARLIGFDADPRAIARAGQWIAEAREERVTLVAQNFDTISEALSGRGVERIDGVLFDLGVSSDQLDRPEAGFTYRADAPLDMRIDRSRTETAAGLIGRLSESDLKHVLARYGEEPASGRIARTIHRAQQASPLETTGDLRAAVARALGRNPARPADPGLTKALSRVFQALRIAVNDELGALGRALSALPRLMTPGGRIVVISYHSLEDRIVKHFFRAEALTCVCPPRTPVCVCGTQPTLRLLTRRAVRPSAAEIERNPRARSARLRAAERI